MKRGFILTIWRWVHCLDFINCWRGTSKILTTRTWTQWFPTMSLCNWLARVSCLALPRHRKQHTHKHRDFGIFLYMDTSADAYMQLEQRWRRTRIAWLVTSVVRNATIEIVSITPKHPKLVGPAPLTVIPLKKSHHFNSHLILWSIHITMVISCDLKFSRIRYPNLSKDSSNFLVVYWTDALRYYWHPPKSCKAMNRCKPSTLQMTP